MSGKNNGELKHRRKTAKLVQHASKKESLGNFSRYHRVSVVAMKFHPN